MKTTPNLIIPKTKTKIVCTIGPSSCDVKVIKDMIKAGMNVARFNLSHGTYDKHHSLINAVKAAREELNVPVAIMIDTKGPEVRIRQFKDGSVNLEKGQQFTLTSRKVTGTEEIVQITDKALIDVVKPGNTVLLNDGLIRLKVTDVNETDIICKVVVGGVLSDNKSINVPGVKIDRPYLSVQDRKDLAFGLNEGVDIFAISFVGKRQDVEDVRRYLINKRFPDVAICAKIESQEGVNNLEEIVDAADSVMVARGDLGVEVEFSRVPKIQKDIINCCLKKGKNVITATEMLQSMTVYPRPTRAEISDVANAVLDGSSCVMLSGETSAGEHPVESVKAMQDIIIATERNMKFGNPLLRVDDQDKCVAHAACDLANTINAKAILASTARGHHAKSLSSCRPRCPIIACTYKPSTYNQMAMYWGVCPTIDQVSYNTDQLLHAARKSAADAMLIKEGDTIVQTCSSVVSVSAPTKTNMVVVSKL